jgi:hypothetical protein
MRVMTMKKGGGSKFYPLFHMGEGSEDWNCVCYLRHVTYMRHCMYIWSNFPLFLRTFQFSIRTVYLCMIYTSIKIRLVSRNRRASFPWQFFLAKEPLVPKLVVPAFCPAWLQDVNIGRKFNKPWGQGWETFGLAMWNKITQENK